MSLLPYLVGDIVVARPRMSGVRAEDAPRQTVTASRWNYKAALREYELDGHGFGPDEYPYVGEELSPAP